MALETRPLGRQLLYLLLGFVALVVVLSVLSLWF
jgi:hypothetical protein